MSESILETAAAQAGEQNRGPIVLGLRNGPRAGAVIQLVKRKSYLGAGQLASAGAHRPRLSGVHCLILRGARHTVVRRWSAAARLNGRSFDDAILEVGDRLQLGATELEVLPGSGDELIANWRKSLGANAEALFAAQSAEFQKREAELARRAGGLERHEHELQQRSEDTDRRVRELDQRQTLIDKLAVELCDRERAIDDRRATLDQLHLELDARAAELAALQAQARNRADETAKREQSLAEREQRFAAAQESFSARHLFQQGEKEQHDRQLETLQAELTALRSNFESELARLAAERQHATMDWQAEKEKLAAELAQRRQGLDCDLAQFERERRELEDALARFAAERTEVAERVASVEDRELELQRQTEIAAQAAAAVQASALSEREHELARQQDALVQQSAIIKEQQANLERQQEKLLGHEQNLASRHAEMESRASLQETQRVQLEVEREKLTAEREASAEACQQRENELAMLTSRQEAELRRLSEERKEFERQWLELATERAAVAEKLAELEVRSHSQSVSLSSELPAGSGIARQPGEFETAAETDSTGTDSAQGISEDDIFRRLESFSLLRKEPAVETDEMGATSYLAQLQISEVEDCDEAGAEEESASVEFSALLQSEVLKGSNSLEAEHGHEHESDEQSIERTRKGNEPTPVARPQSRRSPPPFREPVQEVLTEIEVEATEADREPIEPRRTARPETNMSALRELANMSTQAALDTHARQVLGAQITSTVLIVATCLVSGVMSLTWSAKAGAVGLYISLACLIGAFVWGARLPWLVKAWIDSKPLPHDAGNDGDRAANDVLVSDEAVVGDAAALPDTAQLIETVQMEAVQYDASETDTTLAAEEAALVPPEEATR